MIGAEMPATQCLGGWPHSVALCFIQASLVRHAQRMLWGNCTILHAYVVKE